MAIILRFLVQSAVADDVCHLRSCLNMPLCNEHFFPLPFFLFGFPLSFFFFFSLFGLRVMITHKQLSLLFRLFVCFFENHFRQAFALAYGAQRAFRYYFNSSFYLAWRRGKATRLWLFCLVIWKNGTQAFGRW